MILAMTCVEFAYAVSVFHHMRNTPVPVPKYLVEEAYPEYQEAIDKAFELPKDWNEGRVQIAVEEDCKKAKI